MRSAPLKRQSRWPRVPRTTVLLIVLLAAIGWVAASAYLQVTATPSARGAGVAERLGSAAAIAQGRDVVLELVFLDNQGLDTRVSGTLDVTGSIFGQLDWKTSRPVSPDQFEVLTSPEMGTGRTGLRVRISPNSWTRRPTSGAQLVLRVSVAPEGGKPFTADTAVPFP